jgi:hypothetical protein
MRDFYVMLQKNNLQYLVMGAGTFVSIRAVFHTDIFSHFFEFYFYSFASAYEFILFLIGYRSSLLKER